MRLISGLSIVLLVAAGPVSACSAGMKPAADTSVQTAYAEEPAMNQPAGPSGVADLPYARGRTFDSLDQYLAHLESTNATIDLPYWRPIGPDVYEWVVHMPEAGARETATRAELMQRYGFTR